MPETIRAANERLRSRPRRGGFLAAFVFATLCIAQGTALGTPAHANAGPAYAIVDAIHPAVTAVGRAEVATFTLTLGLLCFAVLATVVLVRMRKNAEHLETAARDEAMAQRAEIERLKTLLLSEPQVLVAWAAGTDQPDIFGDIGLVVSGSVPERVLAFGSWLEPAAGQRMEDAVETLRSDGRGFVMTLTTNGGRPIEAEGRAVGGSAVLRLRDVSGIERELIDLAARHDKLLSDVETMKALLNFFPAPVGARDQNGRLIFVNAAYARAVEAEDPVDAVACELELLDRAARENMARGRASGTPYAERLAAGRR